MACQVYDKDLNTLYDYSLEFLQKFHIYYIDEKPKAQRL